MKKSTLDIVEKALEELRWRCFVQRLQHAHNLMMTVLLSVRHGRATVMIDGLRVGPVLEQGLHDVWVVFLSRNDKRCLIHRIMLLGEHAIMLEHLENFLL